MSFLQQGPTLCVIQESSGGEALAVSLDSAWFYPPVPWAAGLKAPGKPQRAPSSSVHSRVIWSMV